jgi:hypothetical protein
MRPSVKDGHITDKVCDTKEKRKADMRDTEQDEEGKAAGTTAAVAAGGT